MQPDSMTEYQMMDLTWILQLDDVRILVSWQWYLIEMIIKHHKAAKISVG